MFTPAIIRRRRRSGGANPLADYTANGFEPKLVANFRDDVYAGTISSISDFSLVSAGLESSVGEQRLTGTVGTSTIVIPAAKCPSTVRSILVAGEVTYTDNGVIPEITFYRRLVDNSNYLQARMSTISTRQGWLYFSQRQSSSGYDQMDSAGDAILPGTNVPFAVAGRHAETVLNGASDGVSYTANTTPTVLFNQSTADFSFINPGTAGHVVRLERIVMWEDDIGDAGIEEASSPAFFT